MIPILSFKHDFFTEQYIGRPHSTQFINIPQDMCVNEGGKLNFTCEMKVLSTGAFNAIPQSINIERDDGVKMMFSPLSGAIITPLK